MRRIRSFFGIPYSSNSSSSLFS